MKLAFGTPLLGMFLLLPLSTAHAQAPSLSPISSISINAGVTATVNVVAVDLSGDAITLTSSLPAFATLNPPTTGTGSVSTTLTLAPTAGDVGTHTGSVTATAGGETATRTFEIMVGAAGSNQAPVVTAPALQTVAEGANLAFAVTVVDLDADAIASLTASGLPTGAVFTPNGTNTSATFSWTPSFSQSGDYDVVFTATSGSLTGGATTHIHVENVAELSIDGISDKTVVEGSTTTVNVNVTGPTSGTIALTASLPAFATLNAPTTSTGTGTLATTITISPPTGTTGTFQASVTATAGSQTDTEDFAITVTPAGGGGLTAEATLLGAFNTHKKFVCFRVEPLSPSFDLRTVDLSNVKFQFGGASITALAGKTHVGLDCDDGDDFDDCDDDGEEEGDDAPFDTLNCETQLHACFAMEDVQRLFGESARGLPGSFMDATLGGTLVTGESWTASMNPKFAGHNGNKGLGSKVSPNPLNPTTKLTFRLSQPGKVRVAVYDLQGRFVKMLLDENRVAGEQSVAWNGRNSQGVTVASGLYLFRIQAPEGEEVQRVTVLK